MTKRRTAAQAAVGIAIVNSVGSLGGFVGPYVMGWTKYLSGGYYLGLIIWSLCGLTLYCKFFSERKLQLL